MRNTRSAGRTGRILVAAVISLGLIAAACSKKDSGSGSGATTTAGSNTTVVASTTPETTAPAPKPVPGGELVVSGEAEVANPWTPAAMQCDSYCQQRARAFFDPVAAVGADMKVHGVLADTITPNADFTEWTIKLRSGIKFTDGTDVNADAVLRNLNETGSGLLVSKALVDLARNADGTFKSTKADDLTFTLFTGKNGDPTKPIAWPAFDFYLTGQWGLIASPTWLDAVKADPTKATSPVGSGPFIVQSYAPRDALVVTKNPNYWMKDADGVQLPYLDKITFRVIEDAQTAEQALQAGNVDIFSTSSPAIIKDMKDQADKFPMNLQDNYTETNYGLIDLAKPGPTSDERIRCAMSKAIDRQELVDLTTAGLPKIANGLFSPGQEGYLDDNGFDPLTQDIEGAKALVADYQKDHPGPVQIQMGTTVDRIASQQADLIKGYLKAVGIDATVNNIPQDQYITLALLGDKQFTVFGWRNHGGILVDQQNYWWNSASGVTDGALSLNFGRINDPQVDSDLAEARSNPDPAKRKAAAEDINRTFAKHCYQIPYYWTIWGTPHKTSVQGLGTWTLPDGTAARDGAGFGGQFWTQALWVQK